MRSPIEEGLYEVETISLLADSDDMVVKRKALDRADVILEWLDSFSRRQLRVYKEPIQEMLLTIKYVTKDIEHAIRDRRSNEDS